jgi:hypothetical protein
MGNGGDDAMGNGGDDAMGNGGDDAMGNGGNDAMGNGGNDAMGNGGNNAMGNGGNAGAAGSAGSDGGGCTPGGATTCHPSFSQSDACGGDERGTWNLAEACTGGAVLEQIEAQCAGSTATDNSEASGTLALDGTSYSRDVTVIVFVEFSIPEGNACLLGGVVTCGALGTTLGALIDGLSVGCADDGSNGCTCTFEGTIAGVNEGTYTVDREAGRMVIDPTGDAITYDYCVQEGIFTARETEGQGFEDQVVQVYACQ